MSMTDPIADMLTRLRNAIAARHRRVDMPSSKLNRVLETEEGRRVLRVILKYAAGGQPVLRELRRVSTPGLRKYVGVSAIPRVRNGLGMAILSTSQGLMSDKDARKANTGGELLAIVY